MPVGRSFRDPGGFVVLGEERVLRVVREQPARELMEFQASETGRSLISLGKFVTSTEAGPDAWNEPELAGLEHIAGAAILEHPRVWFPSVPPEWPAEMLRAAALLTLDLAAALLEDRRGLKDATPFNILFEGPNPVWVDALSVEKRDPGDAIWRPLAQFLRTFLYPLILAAEGGMPAREGFNGRREGRTVAETYAGLGWAGRLSQPGLRWVSIPKWLGESGGEGAVGRSEYAKEILARQFTALRRALPECRNEPSEWSDYRETRPHYETADRAKKGRFVENALGRFAAGRVLDLGSNDGEYAELAARAGHRVVAADRDEACIGALWRTAREHRLDILPLVVDLANPTPASGWRNRENASFLERAEGKFDCVTMLALLHHLTITERVPTRLVIDLAADLTTRWAVIEYVSPADGMYKRLLRGRDALHAGDTAEAFENAAAERFHIACSQAIAGGRRRLYCLEKKP